MAQINSQNEVEELLNSSKTLIEKSDATSSHIKQQLVKMKKKSKEIERRISLLL